MTPDALDLIDALLDEGVKFVIVGAHALAVLGVPRYTGDLDVLVEPTEENARRVLAALRRFGAPLTAHGVSEEDFARPGNVYQIGLPPNRIDVLNEISGVDFRMAWDTAIVAPAGPHEVRYLGREAFVRNKRATGRTRDLLDIELLEEHDRGDR